MPKTLGPKVLALDKELAPWSIQSEAAACVPCLLLRSHKQSVPGSHGHLQDPLSHSALLHITNALDLGVLWLRGPSPLRASSCLAFDTLIFRRHLSSHPFPDTRSLSPHLTPTDLCGQDTLYWPGHLSPRLWSPIEQGGRPGLGKAVVYLIPESLSSG